MKKVKAEKLTLESFAPFGSYSNVLDPEGPHLSGDYHDFYRDQAVIYAESRMPMAVSPLVVRKVEMKVTAVEWHNETCEGLMPLNDDAIVHLTPAGGAFDPDQTKVFIVPKGTMISIKPGVYHLTPYPAKEEALHALVLLPERTYINDFLYYELSEDEQFIIER